MNRRGFFGRVIGVAGGAVAAAATANATPTGGIVRGPIPPMQQRIDGVFTLADLERDSLRITHHSDGWSECEFATQKRVPDLAATVVVAAPEYGILFTGTVDRLTIKNDGIRRIHAHTDRRIVFSLDGEQLAEQILPHLTGQIRRYGLS